MGRAGATLLAGLGMVTACATPDPAVAPRPVEPLAGEVIAVRGLTLVRAARGVSAWEERFAAGAPVAPGAVTWVDARRAGPGAWRTSPAALADALERARATLAGADPPAAVVVISDVRPTGCRSSERAIEAARLLSRAAQPPVCVHTVHVGSHSGGGALLQRISAASGCGLAVRVAGVSQPAALHAFQRAIFLGPDPS